MTTKKPKKHTSNGLGVATTLPAAASITGLSAGTIQAAKDAGCSAFKANRTINCDELMAFVETMPESSEDSTLDVRVEKAKDARASRMLKEQKYQERAKLLMPIQTIRQAWARNTIACKTKLQAADNAISVECGMRLGLTQVQIDSMRQAIGKHLRDALKELHVGEWGKVFCPLCKKEITE